MTDEKLAVTIEMSITPEIKSAYLDYLNRQRVGSGRQDRHYYEAEIERVVNGKMPNVMDFAHFIAWDLIRGCEGTTSRPDGVTINYIDMEATNDTHNER